ncbi:hypothetical protein FB451DRAFT_1182068 [Mycena latifolia]|nr:hypothetical protein FB451DRAFT_1182068 [Mycena latifolia]
MPAQPGKQRRKNIRQMCKDVVLDGVDDGVDEGAGPGCGRGTGAGYESAVDLYEEPDAECCYRWGRNARMEGRGSVVKRSWDEIYARTGCESDAQSMDKSADVLYEEPDAECCYRWGRNARLDGRGSVVKRSWDETHGWTGRESDGQDLEWTDMRCVDGTRIGWKGTGTVCAWTGGSWVDAAEIRGWTGRGLESVDSAPGRYDRGEVVRNERFAEYFNRWGGDKRSVAHRRGFKKKHSNFERARVSGSRSQLPRKSTVGRENPWLAPLFTKARGCPDRGAIADHWHGRPLYREGPAKRKNDVYPPWGVVNREGRWQARRGLDYRRGAGVRSRWRDLTAVGVLNVKSRNVKGREPVGREGAGVLNGESLPSVDRSVEAPGYEQ